MLTLIALLTPVGLGIVMLGIFTVAAWADRDRNH